MENLIIAISQFDRPVNLLKINLSTGEREIISSDDVEAKDVTFGLFDFEENDSVLNTVALIATPKGPLLFLKDEKYYPEIKKTKIKITNQEEYFYFQILHEDKHVFGLFYEEKFGIGSHPYNNTREDVDFYYWLCQNVNNPLLYKTYTREITYLKK